MKNIEYYMRRALNKASDAHINMDIPIGAIIVRNFEIISEACNEVEKYNNSIFHAEISAISHASAVLKSQFLDECDMYVTLEPCAMCAQAISLSRIRRLYFGAYSPKYGAVEHGARVFNFATHCPEIIGGVCESACSEKLKKFFKNIRY